MKNKFIILTAILFVIANSCSDFLEVTPQGVLDESQVTGSAQIDKLVIAAYADLGNSRFTYPYSLWPFGSVRSDDAYKGGRDEADIQEFHFLEISNNIRTNFGVLDAIWFHMYVGISRANTALRVLNEVSVDDVPMKYIRKGEVRFIRGHYYFMLKKLFKNIPFIDENVPIADYGNVSNDVLSNDELWNKIAEDFAYAYQVLPEVQEEIGRANKYAAAAHLAKVRLYQAFEQDEYHNVTYINSARLQEVLTLTEYVMSSPHHHLEPDFANNFLPGPYENGPESIFAIQFSHDDGTFKGRLNFADILATPQGLGCCDFHKPSWNLVNAFKTVNGLPAVDTFNDELYDENFHMVDPRLYHTVAIPGYPFKYNPNIIFQKNWNRNPGVYGIFASLKENVDPTSEGFVNLTPFFGNSKNRIVIRYADVVLMRAEALIELGREQEALPLINKIRARAQASVGRIPYAQNLQIELYEPGVNIIWNNTNAREALRWERRLEFAMEGQRFFDLVRWGIAAEVLHEFFATEKYRITYYEDAVFTKNRDEYLPIPQAQIDFSRGLYRQNPNY